MKEQEQENGCITIDAKVGNIFQIYGMITALSPLVDTIDKNVQVGTVKKICASAAKAALDTLNTGGSTKYKSLKEAVVAFQEETETDAMHKIFLNRDELVQEIIQITLNHNVNMEYTPTLK